MFPELTRKLDPRWGIEAAARPIANAVNIPLSQIRSRTHELPPPDQAVLVAAKGDLLEEAITVLHSLRRTADATVPEYGPATPARLWRANPLLEELDLRQFGSVLDLGCGAGRDAVYLAGYGLDVWGIDHLPDAIVRGESLADRYLELECRARITFETATIAESLHRSADLVLALFSADRSSLAKIGQRLSSGSTLLFQGFTTENRHRTGKPALSRSFDPDVLRELLPDWVWLDLREHDSQKGSSISLLARKG